MEQFRHHFNPFAIQSEWISIPWYWLVYVFGFFWIWTLGQWLIRKNWSSLDGKLYTDALVTSWFGMLIGSRLAYVFFYHWEYFKKQPLEMMAFWNGGMSFHGGLLGAVISLLILLTWKRRQEAFFKITDLIATSIPLVLGLGRMTNFINGELVGRPSSLPWAVIFPRYDEIPRHPSQIYEALGEGILLGICLWKKKEDLHVPGQQSAQFLIIYGSIRFLIEFFREPDLQLGFFVRWMTMGQILCLFMIVGGLILKFYLRFQLKPSKPMNSSTY